MSQPVEGSELRRVAGHFPTGVSVVTATAADGRPCGLTVNSFTSVSLEPPLVLVCISTAARAHVCIEARRAFGVNVLSEGQEAIARAFASTVEDKFGQLEHHPSPAGHPLFAGIHAWLDCEVVEHGHGGVTHTIFIARVTGLGVGSGRPLVFHAGRYTKLATER